jgi:predicted phage terminase large subunit-like protein
VSKSPGEGRHAFVDAARPAPALLGRAARELLEQLDARTGGPLGRLSLLEWGRRLLPAYFRCGPSRMHLWMSEQFDRMDRQRGARVNVLGPRGGAKSTLGALCYVLRGAVEQREPYIWIVSDTAGQAGTHLASLRAELEGNALLAAAYPRAIGRGPRWRRGALELPNGCVVEAYGTGQRLRGRRRREHRPSLIVCDDLQNDKHMDSAWQRQSSRNWFHGALLKAGDRRTNIVNLATALHRDALAMQLHAAPGWTSGLFQAIERWPENMELWARWEQLYVDCDAEDAAGAAQEFYEANRDAMLAGAKLLWPEHEDLYALMRMRAEEGRTAFEREKQNSPIDPERCEWPEEYFGHEIWFRRWPQELVVRVLALDPSKGADSRHGDYSAYVLLGIDAVGVYYVEADLARRPTPTMVETGVLHYKRFGPLALGVEANQYQELLKGEFEAEFVRQGVRVVRLSMLTNVIKKEVRIRSLSSLLAQRRLRFHSQTPSTRMLVDQLRDFPLGAHDDGPDALEMAVRMAGDLLGGDVSDGLGGNLISSF